MPQNLHKMKKIYTCCSVGNKDGINKVLLSQVKATSNLLSKLTTYDLAFRVTAELDLKTCRRSSSFIIPFLANGLISRIVTT